MLIAVLIGTGLVYKEIDKKTIYTLLAKPISRWQFLLGKFLGLVSILFVLTASMAVIFLVVVFAHTSKIEGGLILAVLFIFLELVLVTAVAMLFSCFSTPILSSVFTLSFYVIGHFSWGLADAHRKVALRARQGRPARPLRRSFPTSRISTSRPTSSTACQIPAQVLRYSALYGLAYTLFILALAMLIFRKRDFV